MMRKILSLMNRLLPIKSGTVVNTKYRKLAGSGCGSTEGEGLRGMSTAKGLRSEKRLMQKSKICVIAALLIALAALSGCNSLLPRKNENSDQQKTISDFVGALKGGDIDDAKKYIAFDTESIDFLNRSEVKAISSLWFSQVKVEFIDGDIEPSDDPNKATVRAKITAPDAGALISNIEQATGKSINEAANMSADEAKQLVLSLVKDAMKGNIEKTTSEVDIPLQKDENGEWKITPDQGFLGALAGGMDKINLS